MRGFSTGISAGDFKKIYKIKECVRCFLIFFFCEFEPLFIADRSRMIGKQTGARDNRGE